MREEPLRPKSIVGIVAPIGPNRKGLHSVPVCMRDLYSSIQLCLLTPPQSPREIIEEFLHYCMIRGIDLAANLVTNDGRRHWAISKIREETLIEDFEKQKEKP